MTIPQITAADLALLGDAFPDLLFDDAERQAVLLEPGSRDVNAAPGSGKTTILAAKLFLLARRWPHACRGICVISHTNVARDEIARRLASTPEGVLLLSYPHFIGTIHAFINQFLALPFLKSNGLEVDIIDNDAFAKRAMQMAMRDHTLRYWMKCNGGVEDLVSTLQYKGADLELSAGMRNLPKSTAKSYPALEKIKDNLTARGVLRFEDMFAFAEALLRDSPALRQRLSHRFPLLFIDEMQDTSEAQEDLLNRLFDESVVVQRYGDINQQILGPDVGEGNLTFPKAGYLSISTSKRFGPPIAEAVSAVQQDGVPVIGERTPTPQPQTLILYREEVVTTVIPCFGRLVLESFSDEELRSGSINALCYRKRGDSKAAPGRHLADYWPAFASDVGAASSRPDSLWALLSDTKKAGESSFNLNNRAADVRRSLLLVLRAANANCVAEVRDGPQLLRTLDRSGIPTDGLRRLCRDLALSRGLTDSDESWATVAPRLFLVLSPLLPNGMSFAAFSALGVFAKPAVEVSSDGSSRHCVVEYGDRSVKVRVGTIASMKGETHLASLVLESHGGQSQRFDLKEVLPALCGAAPKNPKASPLLKVQFRNLYVAMSRPTHMLCLAMNVERAAQEHVDMLAAKGWVVHQLP